MAFHFHADADDTPVLSQINTTPLVDVMLVLLIIFLITIPVATRSVALNLPRERVEVREATPQDVLISVDARGQIYWGDRALHDGAALALRLKALARQFPSAQVHIRGDEGSSYESVGRVLYACQTSGLQRVSFVTDPTPAPIR